MRFVKFFHLSSLDVVFGAMVMQSFVWSLLVGSQQPWPEIAVLGISVWVYYLADRQIDNLHTKPTDPIHQFHLRFQVVSWSVFSLVCELIGFVAIFLSSHVYGLFIISVLVEVLHGSPKRL